MSTASPNQNPGKPKEEAERVKQRQDAKVAKLTEELRSYLNAHWHEFDGSVEEAEPVRKRRGIKVNEATLNYFRAGYEAYVMGWEKTFKEAYFYTLCKFFCKTEVRDGVEKTFLLPKEELPSYDQFRYWWHIEKIHFSRYEKPEGIWSNRPPQITTTKVDKHKVEYHGSFYYHHKLTELEGESVTIQVEPITRYKLEIFYRDQWVCTAFHQESFCLDCNLNTYTAHEFYSLHDRIWRKANPKIEGMLCLSCVEKRLGRQLKSKDFQHAPINEENAVFSELLASRLYSTTRIFNKSDEANIS